MTIWTRLLLIVIAAAMLSGCAGKFPKYRGPDVTSIQDHKADRRMNLLHNDRVLEAYDVALGFAPLGDKKVEGDGKTPEGSYVIDRRNPQSEYYLSVGISYPNNLDREEAALLGKPPGGDIFIHGWTSKTIRQRDWTAGCIAVKNKEMRQIYSMVTKGTTIHILP